jgi:hypothetical protein
MNCLAQYPDLRTAPRSEYRAVVCQSQLSKLVTALEILRIYAHAYAKASHTFGVISTGLKRNPQAKEGGIAVTIEMELATLLPFCGSLPMTSLSVNRLLQHLRNPVYMDSMSSDTLANLLTELQGRMEDELSLMLYFQLPANRREMFDTPLVGWEEVAERFPPAISDIEEMHKCFALSRYPAAVFHSTQVIECGLIDFGKFLQIADPKSGWTAVSNELEKIVVKTKPQDRSEFHKRHLPFLEQMHGVVIPLKSAWRNKISHSQGRLVLMTSDFSPDVAEEIVIASRSFMRRLATELPKP